MGFLSSLLYTYIAGPIRMNVVSQAMTIIVAYILKYCSNLDKQNASY